MPFKRKYTSVFIVTFIAFLSFSIIRYHVYIHYLFDISRSRIYSIYRDLIPADDSFKIVSLSGCKKYIKTYLTLPENYIHSGNFLFYTAHKNISTKQLALKSIRYTHFYKTYKLKKSIIDYNRLQNKIIRKGMVVYIPHSLPPLLPDLKRTIKPPVVFTRGIYLTGNSTGNERILNSLDRFKQHGINAIVFDAKDITGVVNYFSHTPDVLEYNTHKKRTIDDIDQLIRILKKKEMHIIARISVFSDHLLHRKNPRWAIRSRRTGKQWNPNSKEKWCDPTNRFVQDYNISLAIELAEKGVDEIQLDYIRFPTVGNLNDARYSYHFGRMSKEASISHFLKRIYREISRRKTLLSIDIFGVVAWGKSLDIKKTGQRIELLSKYCDIISPMLYPSHFSDDFNGFENPGDNPYYFIYQGCKKVIALSKNKPVRPWLQAFRWRVSNYNADYIIKQIKAVHDAGGLGYLFWSASNRYETVFRALKKYNKKG